MMIIMSMNTVILNVNERFSKRTKNNEYRPLCECIKDIHFYEFISHFLSGNFNI